MIADKNDQAISNDSTISPLEVELKEDALARRPSGKVHKKSNNFQAGLTLFKSFVGMGILTLAFSYKRVGIINGAIISLIMGLLTMYGIITVSYYTSPSPRDRQKSRMPSSA
eukprot:TRINITY_DN17929_c0_g1_i1.p1 TRINITY_DN17929_c0_g1~~TRINITY_DN17929_c0_g1_i1.p1  ORF type:complete len:112 (-),score=21.87 TRINITY_DN17929_c0_g1_i1:10-345(-)